MIYNSLKNINKFSLFLVGWRRFWDKSGGKMDEFKKTALLAVERAGRILYKSLGRVKQIDYKGAVNLVTEIDRLSERTIINTILKRFSHHQILAEESKEKYNSSSYKWIIDPLDGTTNFAHGYPVVCISIALEIDGTVMLGLVYDPFREELFYAEKGKGAYMNNKHIYVSNTDKLIRSLLSTGFAYNVRVTKNNNLVHFCKFSLLAQGVRRDGSAALDLCYTAMGRFDGFWEMNLSPWDLAAGALILEEAGGRITNLSGGRFSIYKKNVAASNELIHDEMLAVIAEKRG